MFNRPIQYGLTPQKREDEGSTRLLDYGK